MSTSCLQAYTRSHTCRLTAANCQLPVAVPSNAVQAAAGAVGACDAVVPVINIFRYCVCLTSNQINVQEDKKTERLGDGCIKETVSQQHMGCACVAGRVQVSRYKRASRLRHMEVWQVHCFQTVSLLLMMLLLTLQGGCCRAVHCYATRKLPGKIYQTFQKPHGRCWMNSSVAQALR